MTVHHRNAKKCLETQLFTLEQDLPLQVGFLIAMVLLVLNILKHTRISTITLFYFIYFCNIMLSTFFSHAMLYYVFWEIGCTLSLVLSVQFFSLKTVLRTIMGFFLALILWLFFVHSTLLKAKTPQAGFLSILVADLTWLEAAAESFMMTSRAWGFSVSWRITSSRLDFSPKWASQVGIKNQLISRIPCEG